MIHRFMKHRIALMFVVLMATATFAFADNNNAPIVQPLSDTYTYTLMPTVGQQQPQATVDTSPVFTITAAQLSTLRTFQAGQMTVANNSSVGELSINGAVFRVVPISEVKAFKTDSGNFITFAFRDQKLQQVNNGVQVTLTLSDDYADRIVALRTNEQSQQVITFARMQVNGVELGLVPRQVNSTLARTTATTDDVTETAFKQDGISLQVPNAMTTAMNK